MKWSKQFIKTKMNDLSLSDIFQAILKAEEQENRILTRILNDALLFKTIGINELKSIKIDILEEVVRSIQKRKVISHLIARKQP